jgi:hypothetical protein
MGCNSSGKIKKNIQELNIYSINGKTGNNRQK